jgi:primosomal protein N' (replication factor Y)
MIAKVIVDVPASQIDRPFDYLIPKEWESFIKRGMRVVVPFGPRKIQGFIVGIAEDTEVEQVKAIEQVLDPLPVLNEELLDLGLWLTKKTLCFAISAYQVMLPAALKAKYEKRLRLVEKETMSPKIISIFPRDRDLLWVDIEKDAELFKMVQKEIEKGNIEVIYHVEDRVRTKKEKYMKLNGPIEKADEFLSQLSPRAEKQAEVLQYFANHGNRVPLRQLLDEVNTTESTVKALVKKQYLTEDFVEVYRDPYLDHDFEKTEPFPLTSEQHQAIIPIKQSIAKSEHDVFLMYGVTGSGKTEVYMQAIDDVLQRGQEAIMLVPEIALTPMMVQRFKGRFGSLVAVLHSGLSHGERYDEWRKIQRKQVKVVVGARSAIFAPFTNLGIIIIDEEHETSYKQEEMPRYHARDVAIYRGKEHHCPVVLGSATPSLESFARAQKGVYRLLTLKERMNKSALPEVEIVDMREELRAGNRSMFSTVLFDKLKERVEKKEQTVLFLNRRGFSTFVMCRNCGFTIECPHCDISLTYHKRDHSLKCHYCAFDQRMPKHCPECESEHIRFFGTGTQKVEEELSKVLPEAKVIRMDVDTTRRKGAHEKLLRTFEKKEADILLGTQMIAKGLDFPDVTLVGVLAADSMLHLADFRAAEKTFQLLTQVSGRAGRHKLPGEVVVQTYTPSHYSVELASRHDYKTYYQREMQLRKSFSYPPFYYLALISVSHPDVLETVSVTEKIAKFLQEQLSEQAIILGPVSSPIARIKDRYRYQCMVKYKNEPTLVSALHTVINRYQKEIARGELQVNVDLNPYLLM